MTTNENREISVSDIGAGAGPRRTHAGRRPEHGPWRALLSSRRSCACLRGRYLPPMRVSSCRVTLEAALFLAAFRLS